MMALISNAVKAATEASTTQLIAALKATRPSGSTPSKKIKSGQVIRGEIPKIPFVSKANLLRKFERQNTTRTK